MANRASQFRQENPGKAVIKRDRHSIHFDMGGGVKRAYFAIDPIHYGTLEDQEIDTTWQPDTGAWQWKLSENRFDLRARSVLNAGDTVQWTDKDTGEYVVLQPLALNWVDNLTDSRQQITQPQAVTAVANDCELYWQNGYGTGRHFRYTAHPKRLIKHLIIDAVSYLPAPTVSNPYLEIEFILKKSANVTLYVDGSPWDFSTKVVTANQIEFRTSGGTVVWYFNMPGATDANEEFCPGLFQLRRQGANRYCTVRIPKTWIDTAVFPIDIDPTFTDGYGGDVTTSIDAGARENNATLNYGASTSMTIAHTAGANRRLLIKFNLSSLETDVTINSSDLYLYAALTTYLSADYEVHSILSANDGWVEGSANGANQAGSCDWNYKTDGALRWAGDAGSDGGADAGCSVSGTDFNASAMGSYSTTGGAAVGTETIISLDTTQTKAWITANYGAVVFKPVEAAGEHYPATSDHATTGYRPKLVVDYTAMPSASVSPSSSPSPSPSASPSVSPSLSPSASVSPSVSPSPSPIYGSVCWGHITGVIEDNILTFTDNWTGTGEITGVGDAEKICLDEAEYMESPVVYTGIIYVELLQNNYAAGDTITLKYRDGATWLACLAAAWEDYTVPFLSLGYVQVRVEG